MTIAPVLRKAAAGAALGALLLAGPDAVAGPELSPGLFERVFDRQEHERQTRELRRAERQAEIAAARARAGARAADQAADVPPLRPRAISPPPVVRLEDGAEERQRAERAAEAARQRALQVRLQQLLVRSARAGSAATQAEIAAARAGQARRTIRGLDRLHAGAASDRNTLGETRDSLSRPLIRTPRVASE